MKILLNANVEKLGQIGDLVEVKPGFARNYLFPKSLAVEVNAHNLSVVKIKKVKVQKELEIQKLSAIEQKQKLEEVRLRFDMKSGESDILFGSVTALDIEKKLDGMGFKLERKRIHLVEPIKRLGNYSCVLKLFENVEATLNIEVVKEGETPSNQQ